MSAIDRLSTILKSYFSDWIKREFFQAVNVSTTVWPNDLDSNETFGENAREEQLKDVAWCFEHILEAGLHKTIVVWPLTDRYTRDLNKTNEIYWRVKDVIMCDFFRWTTTHGYTSVGQPAKTYIYQLCRCSWCYGYRCWKLTRRPSFQHKIRLFAFNIALVKGMNQFLLPPFTSK